MEDGASCLFGLMALGLVLVLLGARKRRDSPQGNGWSPRNTWQKAVLRLVPRPTDLQVEGQGGVTRISFQWGKLGFELRPQTELDRSGTHIDVWGIEKSDSNNLTVRHRIGGFAVSAVFYQEGFELGAPDFEREFEVSGRESLVVALLDYETRSQLAYFLRGFTLESENGPARVEATLVRGKLEVACWHSGGETQTPWSRNLSPLLEPIARLAERLTMPANLAERLAANFRTEPESGVRLACLRLLAREHGERFEARSVLGAASEDPSEEVRLLAAAEQGKTGRPTPEPLLLQALATSRLDTQLAAAEALAQLGTAGAVPALREAENRGPREVGHAARLAIAEIQSRLEGAGAGQLSLAGSEAGTLSLSEEREAGRVSLVEESKR